MLLTLSVCVQVSLKSLQVYDEYGVSEDPLQLQGQVRELKVQLENQTKLILQMQTLLRQNSFSSDLVANTSIMRDQERMQREEHGQEREKKEGEDQAMRDKSSSLNMELERERIQDRMSEQLQQTRSRSASPARSAVFFKGESCTVICKIKTWLMLLIPHPPVHHSIVMSSPQTGFPCAIAGQRAVTTEATDQREP